MSLSARFARAQQVLSVKQRVTALLATLPTSVSKEDVILEMIAVGTSVGASISPGSVPTSTPTKSDTILKLLRANSGAYVAYLAERVYGNASSLTRTRTRNLLWSLERQGKVIRVSRYFWKICE